MATWIAHLRLAENLLEKIEGLDAACFAVGSIAPDSGIPDENWENFTPPPEVSHFAAAPDDAGWMQLADLEFYRRYLALNRPDDNQGRFSFLLGYFFHLVTDNLWNNQINRPTKAQFAAQFEADPKFVWEVKGDWYGLDHIYVRDRPESLFWRVFLGCEYTDEYLDFMPAEAVQQRIDYIKTKYQRRDEKVQALYERPYIYLSQAEMDRFVEETTQQLYRIYQLLWEEGVDTSDFSSALELLSDMKVEHQRKLKL